MLILIKVTLENSERGTMWMGERQREREGLGGSAGRPVHWCQPARCRGGLPTTLVWGWSGDAWRRRPDRSWSSRPFRRRTRPLTPSLRLFCCLTPAERTRGDGQRAARSGGVLLQPPCEVTARHWELITGCTAGFTASARCGFKNVFNLDLFYIIDILFYFIFSFF